MNPEQLREEFVLYAERWLLLPYHWGADKFGGDDPIMGVDCSGLTSRAFRSVGKLGRHERLSSNGLYTKFAAFHVPTPYRGCITFYKDKQGGVINHVAIVRNDFQIIEAAGGGSGTDTLEEAATQNAFVDFAPIYSRPNNVGFFDVFKT